MCVGDTLNSLRRSFAEGYGGRYALNGVDLKLLPGFFTLCLFLVALLLLLLSLRFALCNLPLEVPNKEAGKGARDAEGEDEGPKGLPTVKVISMPVVTSWPCRGPRGYSLRFRQ